MHFKVQIEERNLELHSDFFSKGSKRDTRKVFHLKESTNIKKSLHSKPKLKNGGMLNSTPIFFC